MSINIVGQEQEPIEAFDWHHEDLFKNAPYSPADMVFMLSEGRFLIEGKTSDITDAELFCQMNQSHDAWVTLKAIDEDKVAIAIDGRVF